MRHAPRWTIAALFSVALAAASAQTPAMPATSATPAARPTPPKLRSRISVYDLRDHSVRVLYTADFTIEAPNWSPDGKYLLANSGGVLYRYEFQPDGTVAPHRIAIDPTRICNNDKTLSPDGKLLAFSATDKGTTGSQVFLANSDGTNARLMVEERPSYFHGWSPDGKTLAFVSRREKLFDVYTLPAAGGPQVRLTRDAGHNDGPDYSPDGKWIYINSDRSGTEQIWRIPADQTDTDPSRTERITSDDLQDWFPHPSPDGKWIAFMSFPRSVEGHNAHVQVELRMIPVSDHMTMTKDSQLLQTFFGGQGTINVNSWSPDSTRIAYVSYEPLP